MNLLRELGRPVESRCSFAETERRTIHRNRRAELGSGSGTVCNFLLTCRANTHASVASDAANPRLHAVLQRRVEEYQAGPFPEKWKDCKVFKDHRSMLESDAKPEAAVVGIPPAMHGKAPSSALYIWHATKLWKHMTRHAQGLRTLLGRQWISNLPRLGFT